MPVDFGKFAYLVIYYLWWQQLMGPVGGSANGGWLGEKILKKIFGFKWAKNPKKHHVFFVFIHVWGVGGCFRPKYAELPVGPVIMAKGRIWPLLGLACIWQIMLNNQDHNLKTYTVNLSNNFKIVASIVSFVAAKWHSPLWQPKNHDTPCLGQGFGLSYLNF